MTEEWQPCALPWCVNCGRIFDHSPSVYYVPRICVDCNLALLQARDA